MGQRANAPAKKQTNLAWATLLDLDGTTGPLHERLTRALRTAIRSGRIPECSALPASRTLAGDLGCSRWAVTEAYAQLGAEGYVQSRTGSATLVRSTQEDTPAQPPAPLRRTAPPIRYDLAPGLPDLRAFPRRRWLDALRTASDAMPYDDLGPPEPAGHPRLRRIVAEYLQRSRGASATADDVVITSGATDGAVRIAGVLAAEGQTRIAVEDPGWTRLRDAIGRAGLAPAAVPVDADGLVVEAIPPQVRAVLLTPAHQFPTGVVLAPHRRTALVEWARRVDGVVLEDDYDAEFRYDRRPVGTVQGSDPSRVVLLGSLSKTLVPALGLGWMVIPQRLVPARRTSAEWPAPVPVLDQLAFASLIETGAYDRQLRSVRRSYLARRDALVDALGRLLPGCAISGVAAGLHLVLALPPGTDAPAVVRRAAAHGLRVTDLAGYRIRPVDRPALVLGYGNLAEATVEAAVTVLAAAVRAGGPAADGAGSRRSAAD